jgi:energy-coupling factor transport system substrate-specific component
MATFARSARSLWALNGGIAAYSLIGAALYGVLGLFVARYGAVALRPGFAVVPFVGFTFGPIAGFATGFIGQGVVEGITGTPGYSLIHGLATGLTGLVAGLAPLYLPRLMDAPLGRRALAGAVAGAIASAIGGLVLLLPGAGGEIAGGFLGLYLPQVLANAAVSLVLVPIIVYAWDPLAESLAP